MRSSRARRDLGAWWPSPRLPDSEHVTPSICAADGAGVMGRPRTAALGAGDELRQGDAEVRPAPPLTGRRSLLLRQWRHRSRPFLYVGVEPSQDTPSLVKRWGAPAGQDVYAAYIDVFETNRRFSQVENGSGSDRLTQFVEDIDSHWSTGKNRDLDRSR